ncbi:MAG: hypothetical protein GDA36_00870 [Rhodobacteraceae bacterium]|nr:hypothetical protein [Paracoccaceae bacterium]
MISWSGRVLADKAYASKVNRDALRGCHRDGIMRKTARHQPGWPQQEVQLAMAATGQNLR